MSGRGPSSIDAAIGRRIKLVREQRGLSRDDLGLLGGVTFQQIHKYEHGLNAMTAGTLVRIARALQVSVADLCGEEPLAFVAAIALAVPAADRPHAGGPYA